ncbi:MAG: dicarboxylate/amino acid:cation symporter [Paludibacteraceae bacterium]|nr:dicarboxylate/amino acid:cation symporter [Paludibacteraceae bacterium]
MREFSKKIWKYLSSHLLLAVVLMIALGIVFGQFAPLWFVRIFTTFNGIFSALLSFVVPLLILALVTAAIAETGNGAGKMLVWTILLAYISTILAGFFTYGVSDLVFPKIINMHEYSSDFSSAAIPSSDLEPYFTFAFPPIMDTMSALLLSFMIGLACLRFDMPYLKGAVFELRNVVMMIIERVVLPLLPIYIFGVFMKMTIAGEMAMITHAYLKVIGIMVIMFLVVLLLQYLIAAGISHRNPFKLFHCMFPAFMTALASSSSAATLPVTLRCAEKMGAKPNVVNFVIPMCANIHLSGASVRTVALAVATMLMFGVPYTTPQLIGFILVFSITVLAAPGIPGGVIMAAIGMIEVMLGFNAEMSALIVTLSIALDSIGTAVNVCGDGALMMIIDRIVDQPNNQNVAK